MKRYLVYFWRLLRWLVDAFKSITNIIAKIWHKSIWGKILLILIAVIIVIFGGFFAVGAWYIRSQAGKPLTLGATFIPSYAEQFGLNPQQTMDAMINDLHVRRFRLVSYWDEIEPEQGKYNFSTLDWEFAKANATHAKITLAIGLRQPRWPECHAPSWINTSKPENTWQPALESFMQKVIERYKNNPALESYQLENEYWNNFGKCPVNPSRGRLVSEFNLVKKLDARHPIIMSRSNNLPSLVLGQPQPDIVGFSIYRKVWNTNIYHGYFDYLQPPIYYAAIAGLQKIFTGRNTIVHELQAEPWPPRGAAIKNVSLGVQNQTMNARQLQDNVNFAKQTGIKTIDLWGAPYWYYRMVKLHDPTLWNTAKQIFSTSN